jgi:hypothetical protein
MNRLISFVAVLLVIGTGSCCSKKRQCDMVTFDTFEAANFPDSAINGGVRLSIYDPKSGFTNPVKTIDLQPEATAEPKVTRFKTEVLDVSYDYAMYFTKTGKEYRITGFTGDKVTCGKCFMKTNNQFGYELSGYTVNNRGFKYSNAIRVYNN